MPRTWTALRSSSVPGRDRWCSEATRPWWRRWRSAQTGRGSFWRKAVENRARLAAETDAGDLLCLGAGDDAIEIWDPKQDLRLSREKLSGMSQVVAVPGACVTLADGVVRRYDRTGASRILREQATAVAWAESEILVASGGQIHVHATDGRPRASYPADVGATAVGRLGAFIGVGFRDGNIELVPTEQGMSKPSHTFEAVPSSPVVGIVPGPAGTLIAGFANGVLGLWRLENGLQLEHARLHGPVIHLVRQGPRLHAASELGQHLSWDLGVFDLGYCDLLDQIWRQAPIVWEGGLPVVRPPPEDHRCR
jgi:hypothetical protein